ncbi:MAG: cation transporter [Methyloprofundus sp.]|nr:cation transporter [Methyloprofundus sp.]MDT8426140.1 cation transporter [Methyloprofundus sp.]
MTCTLCQYTIKKALKGVEGVVEVDVDFTAKTATVRFNSAITKVDALINATTNVGYPTTIFLQ